MKARDIGLTIGRLPSGALDNLADVPGVRVGHATIDNARHKTGVTVVLPCAENPFTNKSVAASFVLNGFGKTLGLVQVDELGTLETPIALTNTLNVGIVHDALVEYTLRRCEAEGIAVTSLNPVVCECNDASLNDIRERAVTREHVFAAIEAARADFAEGGVGCGKGTTCHGLKGGVGSASRVLEIEGERFTLGVLAQTNHGSLADLQIGGHPVGLEIDRRIREDAPDKGSCIVIVATDLPVSSRQLRRIVKRAGAGLARCGSIWGHGSGDVFVGFSTANRIPADVPAIQTMRILREEWLELAFRACAEATEEAVVNSLLSADTTTGYSGKVRRSLREFLPDALRAK